jgi:NADP-dependent alcohol dehydrogenase
MQNFIFYNPVKIYFGRGEIEQIKNEIPKKTKVLITYGGGSIKKNGVYEQVKNALAGREVFEFGGIEANPQYGTLMKAINLVKEKGIEFILAVGGGSVIDGSKFIAAGALFDGESWDILAKQAEVTRALPLGTVLTLAGTGSEMNCGAVISREETEDKLVFINPLVFPRFSVLDPSSMFTLPEDQTVNGIVDAFIHVLEQYLTYPVNSPLVDRFAEGVLLTLIEESAKVVKNPQDYDARANIMWCATVALNGWLTTGVPEDWATHMLGHELTAQHGLAHARALAVVLPSLLQIERENKKEKLLQYGERVWNLKTGNENERIDQAILKTKQFFEQLGFKTSLSQYGIKKEAIDKLVKALEKHGLTKLGERGDIDLEKSREIFLGAY